MQDSMWTPEFFERCRITPQWTWPDAITGDKAVVLKGDSGHNYWVNFKVLLTLFAGAVVHEAPSG